ncbi:MAG TPA: 2-hydroxychromene-2-carboxylate isomerase [Candidatus Binataceae bacterium]|nr:2-hydroxychromene-2-carboxylate isomerase [Candidatus Binataceae bacterium]
MEREPLEFWFEFASTYSYPAASRIERLAAAAGVPLRWRPFLLGPIFVSQGWGDSPFNIYPLKGRYMWRDMERLCEKYELPFRRPSKFPRSGLLAARVACMAADEPWCPRFVRAVFRANFAEDREISRTETIAEILATLGQPPREVLARAEAEENKQRLREQSQMTVVKGIFGAPTMIVGDELFWGNDRLEDAIAFYLRPGRSSGG